MPLAFASNYCFLSPFLLPMVLCASSAMATVLTTSTFILPGEHLDFVLIFSLFLRILHQCLLVILFLSAIKLCVAVAAIQKLERLRSLLGSHHLFFENRIWLVTAYNVYLDRWFLKRCFYNSLVLEFMLVRLWLDWSALSVRKEMEYLPFCEMVLDLLCRSKSQLQHFRSLALIVRGYWGWSQWSIKRQSATNYSCTWNSQDFSGTSEFPIFSPLWLLVQKLLVVAQLVNWCVVHMAGLW